MAVYFDEHGNYSPFPVGLDAARKHQSRVYNNHNRICPHCNTSPHRFVKTDLCHLCSRLDAIDFYNLCTGNGWPYLHDDDHYRIVLPPEGVHPERVRRLSHEQKDRIWQALDMVGGPKRGRFENGVLMAGGYIVSPDMCSKAGHIGLRTLQRECVFCQLDAINKEVSKNHPRINARKAGQTWYTPDTPCTKCGELLRRRVQDDVCECSLARYNPTQRPRPETEVEKLMAAMPDTYMARKEARALGFRAYRSGPDQPWRYTSSGNRVT